MKDKEVTSSMMLVDTFETRMKRLGTSRYQLAYDLARNLGVTPHATDKRLARMFTGTHVGIDFITLVAKELGLKLTIGDRTQ